MEDLENEVMSQIDWEMWLNSNTPDPEVLNFLDDLGSGPDPPQLEHSSSNPSPFGQIEHFLMTDDDQLLHQNQNEDQELYHNFLSDILVDSPPLHSDVSDDKVSVNNNNNTCSLEEATTERNVDDDPVSRKRLRQLKNRDAAVRSRERKKMYVKDIEMKSKYLEAECRRLGWLLQSVCAENQSLHLQLQLYQSGKAPGVPVSKQESAVLLIPAVGFPALVPGRHVPLQFSPGAPSQTGRACASRRGRRQRLGKSGSEKGGN
ncbi:Basic-leucine zipper domain [Dillenia turbinata]|uniref:Basic-leucine zipper domain n=1 Tax=Dillenia turbinata TaxID=194707 RepID=A0AAN8ZNF6_9MAGN